MWPEASSPEEAMDAAFEALWDCDRRDIAAQVDSHSAQHDPAVVCFAVKSDDGSGIKYQTADRVWHHREMIDTPEQSARRPVAAVFDSTRVYWQNLTVIDLSSALSLPKKGSVDALDIGLLQWSLQTSEVAKAYLKQLRTLPLELLYAHTQKIKRTGRIIMPLQRAIDTIIAETEALGRTHVSKPTLFIDRSLSHRGGVKITSFGGAMVQDFGRSLTFHSDAEEEALRVKYERLPISIRQQVEIFACNQGLRGIANSLSTLAYAEFPDGEAMPVVNATGDGPADTGPGKYALVTTEPHATPVNGFQTYAVSRYIVRIPDTAVSPEGYVPEFPQDYTRPAEVETFRVPAGRALHDTSAWMSRKTWVPAVGYDGKASRVFVPQRAVALG